MSEKMLLHPNFYMYEPKVKHMYVVLSTTRGRFILVKFKPIQPFHVQGILSTIYALVLLQVPCKLSFSSYNFGMAGLNLGRLAEK